VDVCAGAGAGAGVHAVEGKEYTRTEDGRRDGTRRTTQNALRRGPLPCGRPASGWDDAIVRLPAHGESPPGQLIHSSLYKSVCLHTLRLWPLTDTIASARSRLGASWGSRGGILVTRVRPGYSDGARPPLLRSSLGEYALKYSRSEHARPHTAFSPIASDACRSARTRSSPFSGMTTASLILPRRPQDVPTLIRRGWVGRPDFLLGISPKVRNTGSAFSPPAQRAARSRTLRTDSLLRPPPRRGILFPSAPSAKLVLGSRPPSPPRVPFSLWRAPHL
jgi:hypothetical protein